MPDSPATPAPAAPETIIVHNDLIFGPHAHTTPAQTATLTSLNKTFTAKILAINPAAARRLHRDGLDLVLFNVKDSLALHFECLRAKIPPDKVRFITSTQRNHERPIEALIGGLFKKLVREAAPTPPVPPTPLAPNDTAHPAPAGDSTLQALSDTLDPLAHDTAPDYLTAPQLIRLITLGEPESGDACPPPNYYQQHGITPADAPALQRMYLDPEIIHMAGHGAYNPSSWARDHIMRALVELRAPGTAQLMLDALRAAIIAEEKNDAPQGIDPSAYIALLPELGDEACAATIAALNTLNTVPRHSYYANSLAEILGNIGKRHPHLRAPCLDATRALLANHPFNDPSYNGFLVSTLLDIKAVEAAPLIEQAHATGHVDDTICGDWEDVQIALGLKEKRDTPRPDYQRHFSKNLARSTDDISDEEEDSDTSDTDGTPYYSGSAPNPFPAPHRHPTLKPGRNAPCPCGSGKKYKKCCMEKTT